MSTLPQQAVTTSVIKQKMQQCMNWVNQRVGAHKNNLRNFGSGFFAGIAASSLGAMAFPVMMAFSGFCPVLATGAMDSTVFCAIPSFGFATSAALAYLCGRGSEAVLLDDSQRRYVSGLLLGMGLPLAVAAIECKKMIGLPSPLIQDTQQLSSVGSGLCIFTSAIFGTGPTFAKRVTTGLKKIASLVR